jgi:spore germination protein KA
MLKYIKKLFFKTENSQGVQYKDIDTNINQLFYKPENSLKTTKTNKLKPSKDFKKNILFLQKVFDKCGDIVYREINIMSDSRYNAVCIYVGNMIPSAMLEDTISRLSTAPPNYQFISNIKEYCKSTMGINESDVVDDLNEIISSVAEGELVIFINGIDRGFAVDIKQPPSRAIEQPVTENVIRGPREGFTENHATNICLIRKKIKSPNLKVEGFKLGKQTNTNVSILYMSNIANKQIVEETRNRLNKIDIDSVLDANYIEEYLEDSPFSLFPTMFKTEKPDVACGKLLEGRVVIVTDSVPAALCTPTLFIEFFMSPDDYYLKSYVAILARLIRFISFTVSITLPAAYVSLVTFHNELLPTDLAVSIIRGRAIIPFTPMFEALFMLATYLILQEADIRMPKTMGQAVSVVGGLVLGQAAISSGIVSGHMIIVVAFAAVSALALPVPELQLPAAYVRFGLLVLGGLGGMVGLTCGIIFIIMHLLSLRSFGVPYLAPIGPLKPKELVDTFIRMPLWAMKKRPKTITWKDSIRRKSRPATNPVTEEDKQKED